MVRFYLIKYMSHYCVISMTKNTLDLPNPFLSLHAHCQKDRFLVGRQHLPHLPLKQLIFSYFWWSCLLSVYLVWSCTHPSCFFSNTFPLHLQSPAFWGFFYIQHSSLWDLQSLIKPKKMTYDAWYQKTKNYTTVSSTILILIVAVEHWKESVSCKK